MHIADATAADPVLVAGVQDDARYGFRFEGVDSHREALEMRFDGNAADLTLDLSGYDIDFGKEVRAFVNGTLVGYLAKTPDKGLGPTSLTIPRNVLSASGNTLRLEQKVPGYAWGVTQLLLSGDGGTDTGGTTGAGTTGGDATGGTRPARIRPVGGTTGGGHDRRRRPAAAHPRRDRRGPLRAFASRGVDSHREALEMRFDGDAADLTLELAGYDIDFGREVRAFVNGTPVGYLEKTPDKDLGADASDHPPWGAERLGQHPALRAAQPGLRLGRHAAAPERQRVVPVRVAPPAARPARGTTGAGTTGGDTTGGTTGADTAGEGTTGGGTTGTGTTGGGHDRRAAVCRGSPST